MSNGDGDAVAARDWRRLRRLSKHRPKAKVYFDRARRCFGAIQQSRPRETRQSLVDMGVAALPLLEPPRDMAALAGAGTEAATWRCRWSSGRPVSTLNVK